MSTIEHLRPKGLFHNPAFSQAVVASGTRTVYVSGQVSIGENGALVGAGDLAAQTTQAMRNVGLTLACASPPSRIYVRPSHRRIAAVPASRSRSGGRSTDQPKSRRGSTGERHPNGTSRFHHAWPPRGRRPFRPSIAPLESEDGAIH